MSICENAMVLNLQIGAWTGRRLDRGATHKVTSDAGADEDAARVNKLIVPKAAMQGIVTALGAIRTHFYTKTLPWKDNGDRLITRMMYQDFIAEHERLVSEYRSAVERFLSYDYPQAIEQAGFRMGDLFDPDDYPSTGALRAKFYVTLDIDAISQAGDFRVQMERQQLDGIRHSMEQAMQERLGRAMHDVWERIAKVVQHFHDKMADKDAVFRATTVTNLTELADLLPGLNLTNDPGIEEIRRDILATIGGYDPKDLRADETVRFEAAEEAKQIMERMRGFMGAFAEPEMKQAA